MSDQSRASKEPQCIEGTRLCLSLTRGGLKAYGNREALTALSQWLAWIAQPDPSEHFECHVRWRLEDEASAFEGKKPKNVWVVMQNGLADHFEQELQIDELTRQVGFELTFMAVTERELDDMVSPGWQETSGQ